jgi:UDP-N-acetylmuramoyl-L-alanyl-D-glutamate--2,6-diaminopimelate ligase
MLLSQLLPDVTLPRDVIISGLVMDSRRVEPGDAFAAIAGFGTHGLAFVEQAREKQASAILFDSSAPSAEYPAPADAIGVPNLRARLGAMADQFHGEPSAQMTTIGVTGTSGKTSTVQLLAQALELRGVRSGTIGTLGVGMYGDVQATGLTTPQVLQNHAFLADLRDAGAKAVAMEVSSHALDQGRVDAVHFSIGVFTNLTRDHLDYHGDMQTYGAAKARLFAWPDLRAAVVNVDDDFGRHLFASLPDSLQRIGVSARGANGANVFAGNATLDVSGVAFDLHIVSETRRVHSPLLGRFNIDNLLAVAGVLHAMGENIGDIADALCKLHAIPGRMNRLGGHDGLPLVVVDYSHKPDPLQQALASLRGHLHGKLVCVFGCGGDRDAGKRPQMAKIAEAEADVVIVTDDNPRTENGDNIIADILRGFARPEAVTVQRDRAKAIAKAIAEAGADDIILIAGKGHEPYQEIMGVKHAFDDSVQAAKALEART